LPPGSGGGKIEISVNSRLTEEKFIVGRRAEGKLHLPKGKRHRIKIEVWSLPVSPLKIKWKPRRKELSAKITGIKHFSSTFVIMR